MLSEFQMPKTEYTIRENENTVMIAVKKSEEQVSFANFTSFILFFSEHCQILHRFVAVLFFVFAGI
jgi:hypothetical protein